MHSQVTLFKDAIKVKDDEREKFDQLLKRYEASRRTGAIEFFDVNDLCDIIDEYMVRERDKEAKDAISFALRLHPGNPELMVMDARMHIYHDDWETAKSIIEKVHGAYDAPDYRMVMGDLLLHECNVEQALRHYEIAVSLSGNEPELFGDIINNLTRANYLEIAEEWIERGLSINPDAPSILDSAAITYSLLGYKAKAIETCNRLIDQDPYNARAWGILGDICHDHNQYAEALEAYGYMKALQPDETFSDINIADCHFMMGHFQEARDFYEKVAASGHEEREYALNQLAVCELRLGNGDSYQRLFKLLRQRKEDKEGTRPVDEDSYHDDNTPGSANKKEDNNDNK